MDYLDPKKHRQHNLLIMLGYVLITVAIAAVVYLLLYQAYGYGVGKNGKIIQNGFVFVSSQPNPAQIYLNGQKNKATTNTRLSLPAGRYTMQLQRTGYRNWQRSVTVLGGDVQHFDYPLLVPSSLTSTNVKAYSDAPGLATQSPDQRWLLVEQAGSVTDFDLYDLRGNPVKAPTVVSLPATLLSKAATSQSWQLVEWSNDNQHVLLQHLYDDKSEFVVLDRTNPDQSVNLNTTLTVSPTAVSLNDKKYDQYYLYDATKATLQTATLRSPSPTAYLDHVLAYKSYSNDTMLYATDIGAPAGQVNVRMQVGSRQYSLKNLPAGGTYLLDLTGYSGSLYTVIGSSNEGKAYVYKDPIGQLNAKPKHAIVPTRVLRVSGVNYVAFSANAQFVLAENGTALATYDILNDKSYTFNLEAPIDVPQPHATWMDGNRLMYVSGGKMAITDYDNTNQQLLTTENSAYKPYFSPDTHRVYALAPVASQSGLSLTQTWLLTPADQ